MTAIPTTTPIARIDRPDSAAAGLSVIQAVGNTPLIRLNHLASHLPEVEIHIKAEWFNPGGSVKDRPALNMILDGIETGRLTKGKTILDATSGNTGIAYALFGAALGYKVKLVIPESAGELHKRIMRAYGAELIFSPATEGADGAYHLCQKLHREDPDLHFYPDQYNNPANWLAHYHGTAPEIIRQTQGRITHFVTGLGTSGTYTGNGRRLKEFNPAIQLISFQPDSPMHGLEGLKHMPTSHKPGFYDESLGDDNLWISTEEAQATIFRLAAREGLLVGLSAGASVAAALKLAEKIGRGVIVAVAADNAHKYLNQPFWNGEA